MSSLLESGVSQDQAVAISAAIAAASAILTVPCSMGIVYHIFPDNGEGTLNISQIRIVANRQFYAGYTLLSRISNGRARVKMEMAQEYMAFLAQNIRRRHPKVSPNGPITAVLRLIICANSPVD